MSYVLSADSGRYTDGFLLKKLCLRRQHRPALPPRHLIAGREHDILLCWPVEFAASES